MRPESAGDLVLPEPAQGVGLLGNCKEFLKMPCRIQNELQF